MSKAKILVVDDEKKTVSSISQVLKKHGYEIHAAYNGVAGLKKARETVPDLIILDIVMPLMNGYEVSHQLSSDEQTANIPILLLTAKEDAENDTPRESWEASKQIKHRIHGYDAGAIDFLTKPVEARDLLKRVRFILWSGGINI